MATHRRSSQSGLTQSARVTVLSAAAATAAAALVASPASADPHDTSSAASASAASPATVTTTRARVDRLFEQAEQATERFNKADELADRLREEVGQAQDMAARGQERINHMRGALGAVAGAQYRSGGLDPALALLLSSNPDSYLAKAAALDRIGARQASALHELRAAQRKLDQQRAEASVKLGELERSRAAVARHKRTVERKLAEARELLNSLPKEEREEFAGRSSRSGGRGETPPPALGGAPASSRASAAVLAAQRAVGKPYIWGANGPSGFDCSGLTQWSYAQAGVSLPRTSQEQRYAGRQVSLEQAQPGDLVTYRDDASHVGMYVGNGQVVHAPYPGAPVRYDPVGMMPVASVTRV
ncbi:NlpC/P60 family protein [Streptomyces flavidovirens]|uniref:C40 family peptidase n=1 Tax=Streptomyces flavidovirens TaxID=67298 RepID=UPI0004168871|nr:C40 family peptidase [Streptomyces flavidovirens]